MDAEIKGDVTDTAISAETKGCVADTATSTETNGNFTDTAASAETKGAALGLTAKYNAAAAPSECSSRPRSSTLNAHAKAFVPGRKLGSQFAEDAATSTAIRRSASDESASRVDKPRSYTTGEDRQQTFERLAIGNRSSSSNSSRSRHHGSMSSSQSDHSNLSDRTAGSECPASDSQSVQHNNRDGDGDAGGDADDGEDGGGEDEDGDDAYESQQQTGVGAMAKRRCRFWPSCNNRNCKYRHPSQTCSTYPNCTFGNNCIYIHPCDVQKINSVISRMHGDGSRRPKRKHNDIVRLNNLSSYVKN
ncbi:hypothetical protein LPJ56_006165 [Coemansia sp. RSA 2599]|nr:hypothetical protein LPJ56_006165 [Coemansia sp. RSA 2599]